MTSKRRLLDSLVTLYDSEGRPPGVDRLARRTGADSAEVRDLLESLRSYELVKRAGEEAGYAPTVTGRELLELDLDDEEFLIVEVPDDPDQE